MKHLFRGAIKPPSLHNLTTITIESCPSLKSLFSESAVLCLVNLQELSISHCEMLEEIVSMDTEQNEVTQMLEFPKLIKPPSLHNLTTLSIEFCPSLKSLFSESVALCMVNLQKLRISHCEMLEEIVSMDTEQNEVTQMLEFPKLIKPPSLHNLTTLSIEFFPSLKSLFSESVALCMVNLQKLRISRCKMLEEIVSVDTEQNEVAQMLEFPKLKYITLQHLDHLKSFRCGSNKTVGVLSPLFNQVMFPNLEMLDISGLGCTVKILDELRQIRSHKLRDLTVENLDDVYILFDFEYTKDDAEISILSQLTSLTVRFLPKFVHFTRMFPKGICIFKNLTRLGVMKCDNLRYLFSPSMANSLVALTDLLVLKCEGIEVIIGRQEEDDTSNAEIVEEGMTSRIVFPKLRNLSLYNLDRFRLLSSHNYELVFHSLVYLRMEECPMATKLWSKQLLSAPKLDKVWINREQSIDISNFLDSEGSIPM